MHKNHHGVTTMKELCAVLAFLFACHVTGVAAADPAHIIAFGDSNTATRGKVNVYASRLAETLRTNLGCFYESFSTDGLTWSPMKATGIDASSSPAMVSRLDSGRLVLLWNDVYPQGETSFARSDKLHSERPASWQRGELSIAFSEDEGKSWTAPVVIARKDKAWLSYPYVFEPNPGALWITTMQTGVRVKLFEKDFVR